MWPFQNVVEDDKVLYKMGKTNRQHEHKKNEEKKYSELQESYQERNSLSKGGQKIDRFILSAAYRLKATLFFYISILINLLNIHHSGLQRCSDCQN